MIRKGILCLLLVITYFVYAGSALTKEVNIYAFDTYDKYRQIQYWGAVHVYIDDYNYGSGDTQFLKLTHRDPNKNHPSYITSKSITDHFNREFNRLIKNNLPFNATREGSSERLNEFIKKKKGVDVDNFDEFQAQEEARRNALYGKHPGGIFCVIRVSRTEFPILYEIETTIVANIEIRNSATGEREKNLGFSTPDHIEEELKRAITDHLDKLSQRMEKIRQAKKQK
jgi:hypothetical protein